MSLILGIDTGGTYTDTVVFDTQSNEVLAKAKSFTTKNALQHGIRNAIEDMDYNNLSAIKEVHLSTTLAVNSILENKIANIGLVLLGKDIYKPIPSVDKYVAPAYIGDPKDIFADKKSTMIKELKSTFPGGIDSFVVSSHGTNRGRTSEHNMKALLETVFHVPVYSARDLNNKPGYYERTITSVLNAGLVPVIDHWIDAIESVMRDMGINAPIYIMNSAGKLMSAKDSIKYPLDTLLSGPAASVSGGLFLSGLEDFLLVDMGGTSADVTKVTGKTSRMRKGTTLVNGYPVFLNAKDIQCFSVGGDSQIYYNKLGKLHVGPQKVTPLCVAAHFFPNLTEELKTYRRPKGYEMFTAGEVDCVVPGRNRNLSPLTHNERKVLEAVSEGAHSVLFLANELKLDPDALHLSSLIEDGYLQCISFTPTDLLHVCGTYRRWNAEISQIAAEELSRIGEMELLEFMSKCRDMVTNHLSFSCMQSIANFEKKSFDFNKSEATGYLLEKYLEKQSPFFDIQFDIKKLIVGIGAPVGAWLPYVAKRLGTELVLPQNYDVANAIGAAVTVYEEEA